MRRTATGEASTYPAAPAAPPPPPATAPPAEAPPPDSPTARHAQLFQVLDGFGAQIATMILNGQSGEELAEAVVNLAGEVQYRLLAAIPSEVWLEALRAHPIAAQLEHVWDRVEQFLAEFREWGKGEAEEPPLPEEPKLRQRGDGRAAS